jgi:hypothetical protein
MKWKESDQKRDHYQDGDKRLWKISHTGKEDHRKKLRSGSGKTSTDGEAWLSGDPPNVETS